MKQQYIDLLYSFQCCISNLGLKLENLESIGEDEKCINKLSFDIDLALIILKILKKQINNIENIKNNNDYCLSIEQIQLLINKLKTICNDCCSDISFLESDIDV